MQIPISDPAKREADDRATADASSATPTDEGLSALDEAPANPATAQKQRTTREVRTGSESLPTPHDHWIGSSLGLALGLGVLAFWWFMAYHSIHDLAIQYSLSSRGRGTTAKVVSWKPLIMQAGGGKTSSRVYVMYEYELEFDGHHGTWTDKRNSVSFTQWWPPYDYILSRTRHLEIGKQIPVLYLESDPVTVMTGQPGDSTWELMMKNYGGISTFGLFYSIALFLGVPVFLAVSLAVSGIRYLARRIIR